MNERDPVDEWLRRAFDADQARTPVPPISARVAARIRARQRLRVAVLAGAVLAGTVTLALSVQPAIADLATALSQGVTVDWSGNGIMLALLAMAGGVWLMTMAEEAP